MLEQINDLNTLFDRLMTVIGPAQRFRVHFEEELSKPDGETANQRTVIALLREFEEFAGAYFRYVANGNAAHTSDPDLSLRDLRVAMGKLHAEWVEISRACEQRQVEAFQDALRQADEQTKIFYDRFLGYKTESIPLTYFGRFTNITRSYFNRYPLISLPLYDFNNAGQIELALAHEIGHHIFWNSTQLFDYAQVRDRFAFIVLRELDEPMDTRTAFRKKHQMIELWLSWHEEVFADICGVLLAGPDYAQSALAIAREAGDDLKALSGDDREHPSRYLRPLVALETLRWVQRQKGHDLLLQHINQLQAAWEQQFAAVLDELRKTRHASGDLTMLEIEEKIPRIVEAMLDGAPANGQDGNWVKYDEGAQMIWENFGKLIHYETWLEELGDPAADEEKSRLRGSLEASVTKAQAANLLQKLDRLPLSATFDHLLAQMRKRHNSEADVRQALLDLTPVIKGWDVTCRWECS
jgi:hypothetical protein